MKKLIPSELLKLLPLKYHYLDEIDIRDKKRSIQTRIAPNEIYNTTEMLCGYNYRRTSKLINYNENK